MFEDLNPDQLTDPILRQQVITQINLLEKVLTENAELKAENQFLKDEINRLKGEQSRPKFKPPKGGASFSSEKERQEPAPYTRRPKKGPKHSKLSITRTEILQLDRHTLPGDAQFKGYDSVIVQEVNFQAETILFRKEKYYSPALHQSYTVGLPKGYSGQFGPGVRAWVLNLYYASGISEPKLLEFLHTLGLMVSAGELSHWLIRAHPQFDTEKAEVVEAGLNSSPWQHLDSTATGLFGRTQQCHVLCNPLYTAYFTLPFKDRLSLVQVLLGGKAPLFRLNQQALVLLEEARLARRWRKKLQQLPFSCDWTEAELEQYLAQHLPKLGAKPLKLIKDVLALTNYQSRQDYPVVQLLLSDDAPQFEGLTKAQALCWIHEARHYKKIQPRIGYTRRRYNEFMTKFWDYYRDLLTYRTSPDPAEAKRLSDRFDRLFSETSDYQELDERKKVTLSKKRELLAVLEHPEIVPHNNPAELGVRQRVRKRDVSLQACRPDGLKAWDTFQTLVETAKKLGVNVYHYLYDRISGQNHLPSLADLIRQQAEKLKLGSSWASLPSP